MINVLLTVVLCAIFLSESRLMSSGQLWSGHTQPYFHPGLLDRGYMVEDDHIPFLHRGKLSVTVSENDPLGCDASPLLLLLLIINLVIFNFNCL